MLVKPYTTREAGAIVSQPATDSASLVGDAATRILRDLADPQTLNRAKDDSWKKPVWTALENAGHIGEQKEPRRAQRPDSGTVSKTQGHAGYRARPSKIQRSTPTNPRRSRPSSRARRRCSVTPGTLRVLMVLRALRATL